MFLFVYLCNPNNKQMNLVKEYVYNNIVVKDIFMIFSSVNDYNIYHWK